jgi:hypothetical protein
LFALACAAETESATAPQGSLPPADEAAGVETAEDELVTKITLELTQAADGALSVASAGNALTCGERFVGLAGDRVTCKRTGETLNVILKKEGKPVVVQDADRKRTYFTCTRSGTLGQGTPKKLNCSSALVRPRGTGGLSSPFDATVTGVSLPNAHWVGAGKTLLRGMEPRAASQFDELRGVGVASVIIFKNPTQHDNIDEEVASWAFPAADVLKVPFAWKALPNFETPCKQTLEALRFIKAKRAQNKKVLFHCTVGEDRTGYLAAVQRMLFDDVPAKQAFDQEMCEHGYSSGNPQKPTFVTAELGRGLTPLYRKMAYLVQTGALNETLSDAVCNAEPQVPADFLATGLGCGISTLFTP